MIGTLQRNTHGPAEPTEGLVTVAAAAGLILISSVSCLCAYLVPAPGMVFTGIHTVNNMDMSQL